MLVVGFLQWVSLSCASVDSEPWVGYSGALRIVTKHCDGHCHLLCLTPGRTARWIVVLEGVKLQKSVLLLDLDYTVLKIFYLNFQCKAWTSKPMFCIFTQTRATVAERKRSSPHKAPWSTPWMISGRWFGRRIVLWLLWSQNLKKKMRYDFYPSTKCSIFSIAREEILHVKNCHVLNNRFKMEIWKHLSSRLLYDSQNGNWCCSVNDNFLSDK